MSVRRKGADRGSAVPHEDESSCDFALTEVFAILGKRWSGLILGALMGGPVRFAELSRSVSGISESMLSQRLEELGSANLVCREIIEGPPLGVAYRLTEAGMELRPALEALALWAEHHLGAHAPTPSA